MLRDLFELVEPTIRSHPERPAVLKPTGEEITYRQLGEIVDHYTALCARAGIARGTRVTVQDVRMAQYLFLVLALSRLGAVHVRAPDFDAPGNEGVKTDLVIIDAAANLRADAVSQQRGTRVLALDLAVPESGFLAPPGNLPGFASPDDICIVMGSSGTTGVRKQLGYSLTLFKRMMDDLGVASGDLSGRFLLHVPPIMPYGLLMGLLVLISGGEIVFPAATARATLALLATGKVDEILAAPAVYAQWLDLLAKEPVALPPIKRATIGGSLASSALLAAVQRRICGNLFHQYGASEVGPVARSPVDQVTGIEGAIGKLVDWVDARVVDDQGKELARGQTGELQFRPKPPRRIVPIVSGTAKASTDGEWFAPGDRGTITPDGILCVYGRASEIMNVGGNEVPCAAVEDIVVRFLGGTEPVCALGLPGPNGFDEAVVVVSARHAGRLGQIPACIARTNLRLGKVRCIAIRNFPLGESGKIDRRKLQTMVSAEISRQRLGRSDAAG
jgi:acyl-CoA synthetase (AMP-forming)/AMP-acid ligase II